MGKLYRMLITVVMVMVLVDPLTDRAQEIEGQGNPVSLHAAGRGNPWINLQDGRDLSAFYVGPVALTQALKEGQNQPLSLAAADFDEDGVPDLVSGYAGPSSSVLILHRGNVDAIYPDTPAAQQRKAAGTFTDAPFLSPAYVFALPMAPDFLGTGDFDADGHQDVVAATRGGTALYLLPGDGQGGFDPARPIQLPGAVTALVVGEVNRRDGLADVVVGVTGPAGPQALVFEWPEGALRGEPEVFAAPAEVTALALGQLDEHYAMDLAVAAGNELLIIHGRDRKLSSGTVQRAAVPQVTVDRTSFPFTIAGLAVGDFVWEEHAYRPELALLAEDGTVHILNPATGETITHHALRSAHLVSARVSSLPTDDLVVIDSANHQLHVLLGDSTRQATGIPTPVSLDVAGEPVAVLPMRLNKDALSDLVILKSGPNPLTVAPTAPMQKFYVNSTGDGSDADTGDGVCATTAGECTLRAAIEQADAGVGADNIYFNLGPGTPTIRPNSPLPYINYAVTIDGKAGGATRVELDGSNAGIGVNGLFIMASDSTVRGMIVNRFKASGIEDGFGIALGGNHNIVEDNYLGTDATGVFAKGNENGGIVIGVGASDNQVGGLIDAARNIISGNIGHGVQIGEPVGGASSNYVMGNYIGTDPSGTKDLGNGEVGVCIGGGANNPVGGTGTSGRNIVSGNDFAGVAIGLDATGNQVQGNYIGTDVTGAAAIPNGTLSGNYGVGVYINDASNNTVGGSTDGHRNVIAGNHWDGVAITHFDSQAAFDQDRHTPGTAETESGASGTSAVAPIFELKVVTPRPEVLDTVSNAPASADATGNRVMGNYIGLQENGTEPLYNRGSGVSLRNVSTNIIGGLSGDGNVIAANLTEGVVIWADSGETATGNTVLGNYIGTDKTGIVTQTAGGEMLGNSLSGVTIFDASGNIIGGTESEARNVIGGNRLHGVVIFGSRATDNKVQGNFIGTDANEEKNLGNNGAGVVIDGGSNNRVGGPEATMSNTIAYNGSAGIVVGSGTGNMIRRNRIFYNRSIPIDLGSDGVTLNDAGDGDAGANNLQNSPRIEELVMGWEPEDDTVTGTLDSTPNTVFTLDFFSYDACDDRRPIPGFGQAERFLTSVTVKTNSTGAATFTITLPSTFDPSHVVAVTATDPDGNTSELSNTPFRLRPSTPSFLPSTFYPHTVLLYTVPDLAQADDLEECATDDLSLYVVMNGDKSSPLEMENDASGLDSRDHADLEGDDLHYSLWITPTQIKTHILDLYVAPKGQGIDNALLSDRLELAYVADPRLIVLTDLRELFQEFEKTAPGSPTQDANAEPNYIADYYDAVERLRQYAADHQGIVVDVRHDAYTQDYDYDTDTNTRGAMGRDIKQRLISRLNPFRHRDFNIAIVGDDAVVPFYRIQDPRNREEDYPWRQFDDHGVATITDTIANYLMTDVPYSDTQFPSYFALGRVFYERPLDLVDAIDAYEQPVILSAGTGSAAIFNLRGESYTQHSRQSYVSLLLQRGYNTITTNLNNLGQPRHIIWMDAQAGHRWSAISVTTALNVANDNRLTLVANHGNHIRTRTETGPRLWARDLDALPPFPGAVFMNLSCHSAYSTGHDPFPQVDKSYYHRAMARAALARHFTYYGVTTYYKPSGRSRWHTLMSREFLRELLKETNTTVGQARASSQSRFRRYRRSPDRIDLAALYGAELYGLPTQPLWRTQAGPRVRHVGDLRAVPRASALTLQATQTLTVSLESPHFRVTTDEEGYTWFEVPHGGEFTAQGNGPIVPLLIRSFYFPAGTTGVTVTLVASDTSSYSGSVELPLQQVGDQTFGYETILFTDTLPYPYDSFWTTVYTSHERVELAISAIPLQYDPVTGQVTLCHRMEFQVTYDAPTSSVQVGNLTLNQGLSVPIDQDNLSITMTVTTTDTQPLTLLWLVEDIGSAPLRGGITVFTPTVGTSEVGWDTDSLGWPPGPKVLHVMLEDETETVVATAQEDFVVQGRSLDLDVDKGMYGPDDTQALVRIEVRDESGTEVSGLAGDFSQELDGSPLALTWHEGNFYTTTLDLTKIATGTHVLDVTLDDRPTTQRSFGVDRDPPTSTLSSLAFHTAPFTVTISGEDDLSGVDVYYLQYRVGQSDAWTDWLTRTTSWDYTIGDFPSLSPTFGPTRPVSLKPDTTYYFRVRAVDQVGNEEGVHVVADTATTYVACSGLDGVTIAGPTRGVTGTAYVFTATISPPTATLPVYTWSPPPMPGSLILPGQSVVTYTWDVLGTYAITVTAENCGGSATAPHTIIIGTATDFVFLPLVTRGYEPLVPDRYVGRVTESSPP